MVIILSADLDAHLPYVTKHLQDRYVVLDAGVVLEGRGLTYEIGPRSFNIRYAGELLRDITGVWLRRPRTFRHDIKVPVDNGYQDYCQDAIARHLDQLYGVLDGVFWMSDRYAIMRAENKMLQLLTAKRVGLAIPATTITSHLSAARHFARRNANILAKPIARYAPIISKDAYLRPMATRLNHRDTVRMKNLHLAPSIFQKVIEPKAELRVTVAGRQVFTAKVILKNQTEKTNIRDWHIGHLNDDLEHEAYDLPAAVEHQCVELVRRLGLQYGAIDLIQDERGKYWFIEINPNGQWAFIERDTGQPIGKAIADLLEGRAQPI